MLQVTVRDMRDEDCPQVSRVVCSSFQWAAKREGLPPEQVKDYVIRRGCEDAIRDQAREYRFQVACVSGRIVGVVATKGNEITKLYVDPRLIRKGIGETLFRTADEAIRRAGYRDLVLGTAFEWSVPFYEAMGMSKAGRRSVVCGPVEGVDSMIMKKTLDTHDKAETGSPADADTPS